MTCKDCVHHEKFHDEAFYCESINEIFSEDDGFDATECPWFCKVSESEVSDEQS